MTFNIIVASILLFSLLVPCVVLKQMFVTNINLLGLAMVNWSIGLLDPGGDNSYCGIDLCTGPISW